MVGTFLFLVHYKRFGHYLVGGYILTQTFIWVFGRIKQYLFKLLGTAKGASDMIFFEPRGIYHGLMIELKVIYAGGKKNYPSKAQKQFIEDCKLRGYYAAIAWTFEEAKGIISQYIGQK